MRFSPWILPILAASLARPAAAGPLAPAELPDLVAKVLPDVVNISSLTVTQYVFGFEDFLRGWGIPQERKQSSRGSGFIIDKDGYVLTNNHVVENATELLVTLQNKKEYHARLIGRDPKMDLALLQIRDEHRAVPPGLSPVTLGNSDSVRIAEQVFAVGNPFGLAHTVTLGIISAKNRTIGLGPFDNFLQTDAAINPGNSGGPLFNLKGEVVGINSAIFSAGAGQSAGVGFAIPINEAKKVLEDLKKYGRVPRPWLGILGERITPALQAYYDLPISKGVIVYNLVEDGPADNAGLKQGDIIVEIDGVSATEPYDIERALAKHKPTDSIRVKVRRGKKTMDQEVKLTELPRLNNLPREII